MKFVVSIELGSDEMKKGTDIAAALAEIADTISVYVSPKVGHSSGIADSNGRKIGKWEIKE